MKVTNKEFRLPREFAEKWLKALTSGEYNQSIETLYNPEENGYCCLGVACSLEYPLGYLKTKSGGFAEVISKNINKSSYLKFDLKKIPKELKGDVISNLLVEKLTDMNDSGYDFYQIADWIKENVEFYD